MKFNPIVSADLALAVSTAKYNAPTALNECCSSDRIGELGPLAESPAGLSAPLRGAATSPRPSSFSRGFTPNPASAARPPSAAVESQQLPALLPASGTSAVAQSRNRWSN